MSDQTSQLGTTSTLLASAALGAALLVTGTARAQAPAPATPPAPAPAPAAPAPAAAPAAPAAAPAPAPAAAAPAAAPAEAPPAAPAAPAAEPAEPPAVVAPGTAAPVPGAPPPEEPAPTPFTITTGFGVRFGLQFQNLRSEPDKIGQPLVDEVYVEPRFSGKVLDFVGWTANFAAYGSTAATVIGKAPPPAGPPVAFEVRAMDFIAQLDFMDEFHLWGGRMLTPTDRSNFSGPWFISPWDYPGLYFVPGPTGNFAYVGPRGTEEIGREVGTVAWGDIAKGKFKYYLGVMDLDDQPQNTPLYTARLQGAIIGSEPGFYGSSTYYGAQNIVAIGAAVEYQKRFVFAGVQDNLTAFNADLLAEYELGPGVATLEGAYYMADSGDIDADAGDIGGIMPYDSAFFVVASYLLPKMGPGRLQPLFRYQGVMNDDEGINQADMSIIEGQVNYVMKDYFAKLHLGFAHTDMDNGIEGNAIQFGFQIQQ